MPRARLVRAEAEHPPHGQSWSSAMTAVLVTACSPLVPPPTTVPRWHCATTSVNEAHIPAVYDGASRPLPGFPTPVYRAECRALCSDTAAAPETPRCEECAHIHSDHVALHPAPGGARTP